MGFRFGRNWRNYIETLSEADIDSACRDLENITGPGAVAGKVFLDIGCGSGLSSLTALRLGARRVAAFDLDALSVEATHVLMDRFAKKDGSWSVQRGSVLDPGFLASIGTGDIVYSWGVLHHTGRMWDAIDAAAGQVVPGGLFCIALYNRKWSSGCWKVVKSICTRLPGFLQAVLATGMFLPRALYRALTLRSPFRDRRGMSIWHDALDWLGGYPYEYATAEEVVNHMKERGFTAVKVFTTKGTGCNEFTFRNSAGE